MQNVGEEIAGEYLRWCKGCDFVSYNVKTPDTQGEVDVVGINTTSKHLFVCEVAVHLETGLQYVKANQPDNVERLTKKLSKDIEYAQKHLPGFAPLTVMLWTPIVRDQRVGSKHNQMRDIQDITKNVSQMHGVNVEAIYNERYLECLEELRRKAWALTEECKSPVMRFLQIQTKLERHVEKLKGKMSE